MVAAPRSNRLITALLLTSLAGCGGGKAEPPAPAPVPEDLGAEVASTPEVDAVAGDAWADELGKVVVVEGVAQNAKVGPLLQTDRGDIFIDGEEEWTSEVVGLRVRVTGTVVVRHDLPVFAHEEGDPIRSGMPVPAGTDLHAASARYLLSEVSWEGVEAE